MKSSTTPTPCGSGKPSFVAASAQPAIPNDLPKTSDASTANVARSHVPETLGALNGIENVVPLRYAASDRNALLKIDVSIARDGQRRVGDEGELLPAAFDHAPDENEVRTAVTLHGFELVALPARLQNHLFVSRIA